MANKVQDLNNADQVVFEEPKAKEMELVPVEDFEGKVSSEVSTNDLEEIYALAQEMVKFAHAKGGIGLTLPQIGISKRAFVFLDGEDQWLVMINPEYFPTEKKKCLVYERNLSYEGAYAVNRYKKINAVFYSMEIDDHDRLFMKKRARMMSGLRAFVFQNLTDMLNGNTGRTEGQRVDTPKGEDTQEV